MGKCKSVKGSPIRVFVKEKKPSKHQQQIDIQTNIFKDAINHLANSVGYQREMMIALQQQINCLEYKIRIIEGRLR